MKFGKFASVACASAAFWTCTAKAYEVMNHAAMSEAALNISSLNGAKLFRLGLRVIPPNDDRQVFPRAAATTLTGSDATECWPLGSGGQRVIPTDFNRLSLVQLLRYGACYEDNVDNGFRVFGHFYDPQNGGFGLSVPVGGQQPSSIDWALTGANATSGSFGISTGPNHFTYANTRTAFFRAITAASKAERNANWGLTMQGLGHVVHHLQDMAQPQHVRADDHCDSARCQVAGQYKPSSYEKLMKTPEFEGIIRALAATATTPILFGLPREFWNSTGSTNLNTYVPPTQGIAAYTSTNFVSAGTDYRYSNGFPNQAPNFNYPIPTSTPSEVTNIGALLGYTNTNTPFRLKTVCADVAKCRIEFWGSTNEPTSRKSSSSVFGQDLKVVGNTVAGYPNQFSQNAFTFAASAIDLVPKAVSYSAGLINYFFRGEMQVRVPAEGVYGIIDGGDPASNCKDACGFKKIKLRVTNTTQPINGVAQNFSSGTMTAVVKFSRNTCFTSDFAGDPGSLFALNSNCFSYANGEPIEEQVTADALSSPISFAVGTEIPLTLNFTTPIPINAWNIRLQLVFRGEIGQEEDGVAVHTLRLSTPTPLRYANEYDYLLINQRLYSRADVNASQTLLNQVVPTSCVVGAAGSRTLAASCFNPQTIPTSWVGANGTTLASLNALPTNSHALFVYLADYFGTVNATLPGPNGTSIAVALDVRDIIARNSDNQLVSDLMIGWRNLQAWKVFSRYYLASTDQTAPPLSVSNQRPAFPTTTPVKMTSLNF